MTAKSFGFKTIDVRCLDLILEFIRFIIGLSRNLVHMKKGGKPLPALFFSTYEKLCRLDIGTGIALMVGSPRAHDATADFP